MSPQHADVVSKEVIEHALVAAGGLHECASDCPITPQSIQTIVAPAPHPFSAREIARRDDPAGYAQGVAAGHEDAVAHLEPLIRDAWGDMQYARTRRDQAGREMPDHRMWSAVADRHGAYLIGLLDIRRALKGDRP